MSFSSDKQRRWFLPTTPSLATTWTSFGYDFQRQLAQRRELAESLDNLNKLLGTSVTIPGISWPRPAGRDNLHAAQNMNVLAGAVKTPNEGASLVSIEHGRRRRRLLCHSKAPGRRGRRAQPVRLNDRSCPRREAPKARADGLR